MGEEKAGYVENPVSLTMEGRFWKRSQKKDTWGLVRSPQRLSRILARCRVEREGDGIRSRLCWSNIITS